MLLKNPNKISGDSHTPFSQKLQLALALALPGLALVATAGILAGMPAVGLTLVALLLFLFYGSALPLVTRCLKQDSAVALVAPLLITCRAVCLAWGLTKGGWEMVRPGGLFRIREYSRNLSNS